MPIYEYLCPDCNRIYSFLVRRTSEKREPACPRCGAVDLRKQVSGFAFKRSAESAGGSSGAEGGDDGLGDPMDAMGGMGDMGAMDDPRVEREMMKLMRDAEHMDENDPRQLARLMRKMSEVSGEPFDAGMEEAVRRMEAGEDPERIEEDMGEDLDDAGGAMGMGGALGAPTRDDGLYDL